MVTRCLHRLQSYGIFSEHTVKAVADFANTQATYKSYSEFFAAYNIPTPELFVNAQGEGVPVVDIAARQTQKGTIVLHLPMANPLDANQLYNVAMVVATNSNYRVIAFGNPSGAPFSYRQQSLSLKKWLGIARCTNVRPLVAAELDYLHTHDVSDVHLVGYSYGAHKALIEASYLAPGIVKSLVLVDPVAHPRGLKQLMTDFKSTLPPLSGYADRTQTPTYLEARAAAGKTNHCRRALWRPINIAIGWMLARLDFVTMLRKGMKQHPRMRVAVAWGTLSELGNDAHLSESIARMQQEHGALVHAFRFKDDKHAFANDIYVYAAIIRESLQ